MVYVYTPIMYVRIFDPIDRAHKDSTIRQFKITDDLLCGFTYPKNLTIDLYIKNVAED